MDNDVRAKPERPHEDRRRERRVDHQDGVVPMARSSATLSRAGTRIIGFETVSMRTHDGLASAAAASKASRITRIGEADLDAAGFQHVHQQRDRLPVKNVCREDRLSAVGQRRQQREINRRHPGGGGQRQIAPLQRGDLLLQGVHGRVSVAGVALALPARCRIRGPARPLRRRRSSWRHRSAL